MLGLGINDQVDGDGGGGCCEDPSRIKKKTQFYVFDFSVHVPPRF